MFYGQLLNHHTCQPGVNESSCETRQVRFEVFCVLKHPSVRVNTIITIGNSEISSAESCGTTAFTTEQINAGGYYVVLVRHRERDVYDWAEDVSGQKAAFPYDDDLLLSLSRSCSLSRQWTTPGTTSSAWCPQRPTGFNAVCDGGTLLHK